MSTSTVWPCGLTAERTANLLPSAPGQAATPTSASHAPTRLQTERGGAHRRGIAGVVRLPPVLPLDVMVELVRVETAGGSNIHDRIGQGLAVGAQAGLPQRLQPLPRSRRATQRRIVPRRAARGWNRHVVSRAAA